MNQEQPYPRHGSGAHVDVPPRGLVPARAPLAGRTIDLEPLDPAVHAAELYAASHGSAAAEQIWTYLPWGPWSSEAAFRTWLGGCAGAFEQVWYAFRPRASGRAEGMACYLDIQPAMGVIEIGGIWFGPALQRTRPATEALFLLLDHAMSGLRYRRMQWRCNALNDRSRNAARRLGFRFEGIFYNHMIYKGMNRDTAWYSILDSEWPGVRDVLASWLAEENFDARGSARSSLSALMAARSQP